MAHENLKKVKASERSVVAMQAKYKVCANTNTNTNTWSVKSQRQIQIQMQAKYKVGKIIVKIASSESNHSGS